MYKCGCKITYDEEDQTPLWCPEHGAPVLEPEPLEEEPDNEDIDL